MTAPMTREELATRFDKAANRYRPEIFGEDDKFAGPAVTQAECAEIAAALRGVAQTPCSLSDVTDAQLRNELHARAMIVLGDQSIGVTWRSSHLATAFSTGGMRMASNYECCRTCREWAWFPSHKCAPIWEARIYEPRWQEDWQEVHAHDEEEAAQKFSEAYDRDGEYSIVSRGSAEVEVRKQGEEVISLMDVSAESVPHYYAHARKPCSPQETTVNSSSPDATDRGDAA